MGPTHYRSTAKYAAGKTSRTALRDRCHVLCTYGSSSHADSRTSAPDIRCLLWKPTVREVSAGVTGTRRRVMWHRGIVWAANNTFIIQGTWYWEQPFSTKRRYTSATVHVFTSHKT